MTPSPEVSVVIVAFRAGAYLPACLEALRAAAGGLDYELLVVDNASEDGTAESLRKDFPEARVLENAVNRGFGAAANVGARGGSAPRILLLNPDTQMAPGSLAALCQVLDVAGAGGADLAGPQLLYPDGRLQFSAWQAPGPLSLAFDAFLLRNLFPRSRLLGLALDAAEVRDVDCLSGACLLVRRSCFEALGGFDERFFLYYEDTDLCLRARAAGFRVRVVPAARVVHVLGGSAFQDRRAFFRRFHQSLGLFIQKHHPGHRGRLMRLLQAVGIGLRVIVYSAFGWLARRDDLRQLAGHHVAVWRDLAGGA